MNTSVPKKFSYLSERNDNIRRPVRQEIKQGTVGNERSEIMHRFTDQKSISVNLH